MTAARTILVDLRATQFNGDRGIPAYTQSLAVELVRSHPGQRWLLWHDPRRLGIVHDLVPPLFPDRYLARPRAREQYHDCLRVMRRSDQLFAISRATRRDVVRHGLRGRYCACVGGEDWRKTMDAAVRAFATFHRDHLDHQLAIICKLSESRIAELEAVAAAAGLPAGAVVCTGYVSNHDLMSLVVHAEMLVYPSRYEGLGLPVLEAYGCGSTPVVGSDTSGVAELVIPELACDPKDPVAIAAAMRRLAADPALAKASLAFGRRLLAEELGWERASDALMEYLRQRPPRRPARGPGRMRVAVVAALPPARTGIARYTLRHLQSDRWQTTFQDAKRARLAPQAGLLPSSGVVPAEAFPTASLRERHDAAIFVLGNSPLHVTVLERIRNTWSDALVNRTG